MKKGIHPDYGPVIFFDASADKGFLINSTVKPKQTMKWEDGNEYPVLYVDTSSASHPFYTGKQAIAKAEGRLAKFQSRFGTLRSK